MKHNLPSRESILQSLAGGDMHVLDQLYDAYRDEFLAWARQKVSTRNRDDLIDAWHDTMIMFYEQVRDGKLTVLTCEVKTFLFLIGYRRLLRAHEKSAKIDLVEEVDANMGMAESINVSFEEDSIGDKEILLKEAIAQLPEQSRQILVQRFIEGKSVSQIMESMGYTSTNAVSVTLSRTLKRLKEIISERKASVR